ncbi:SDR family NAD(P)-dependent oxidoreductase [Actinopolymorpha pittospori]|uniref:Short-subunit dehydrogenase n=1 Tax=Actinopolymorpha pittospori TaxID=648752 RepID=A0A927N5Y8_9ACTN|nr:SDR family oxidoreductase [Actinopolymorpha pittospori]MBE1612749.1 short-subunit dehydrogenase [Actinopolymorpha pittospori]
MPTALITGPTAGLGRAYAEAFAKRGFDLVLASRDLTRLSAVAEELSTQYAVSCETLAGDLADEAALRAVEKRITGGTPPIDLVINNAGYGPSRGFLTSTPEDEQHLIDVLVGAVMRLSKAAAVSMVGRRTGAIINISSLAGYAPSGTYGAAKAYVTSFTEGLAGELHGTGVRVFAVCPGYVRTEFHQRAGLTVKGLPGFMWLTIDEVVNATLRHLDSGRNDPVLVPTLRYRVLAAGAKHLPRPLVRSVARTIGMRERES